MAFWTCGRTHPNQEKIAIRNLANQQFNYYQPMILDWRKTAKGMAKVPSPLFPCYLFIEIVDRWAALRSTHGLSGLITISGVPATVDESIIAHLRQREQGGFVALSKQCFQEGDQVRIQTGPFAAQLALVERMSVKERQKILLALLNSQMKVLVAEEDLEAA